MTHTLAHLENGNIEITMIIPWEHIQKKYETVVSEIVNETELPGFRKGKAPREQVEATIDKTKAYEEVIKRLLPEAYQKALTEEQIKPIVYPQITLAKAKEGESWEIKAVTCQRPKIELGEYKKAITELKKEKLQGKIWVPGEEKKDEEKKDTKPTLDELLETIYKTITVQLPAVLIEQEVSKNLSDLIDQTKRLGLTVDQYLSSTGRTADTIRQEFEEQAKRTITLEFALEEISEKEHIEVTDEEIHAAISGAKSEEEKKALEKERYYLTSVLRRQKTIKMLADL